MGEENVSGANGECKRMAKQNVTGLCETKLAACEVVGLLTGWSEGCEIRPAR